MKGIREAAMSQEEEAPATSTWPKSKSPSLFDKNFDSDRYDGSWNDPAYTSHSYKTYKKPDEDEITITLKVPYSKLGAFADINSPLWNDIKAEEKATEIAYDRIEKLLGKNYESKYSVSFNASDMYEEYEVEATLTPVK